METWQRFVNWMNRYGFVVVYKRYFPYDNGTGIRYLQNIVAAHAERKLLLHAVSCYFDIEEMLDECTISGSFDRANLDLNLVAKMLRTASVSDMGAKKVVFDIPYAHRATLGEIARITTFVNWGDADRFLWLCDRADQRLLDEANEPGHVLIDKPNEIRRKELFENLPPWVLAFIINP